MVTVTTLPLPWSPVITAEPISATSYYGATLKAQVDPAGANSTAFFQYGSDTKYSLGATSGQTLGSGTNNVDLTASLSGLQPGTTYHYRVVVTSGTATNYGGDQTFTTPAVTSNKVIYNYAGRMANTGSGQELTMSAKGNLIWDPSLNTIYGVFAFTYKGNKGVTHLQMTAQQLYSFSVASGRQSTLISLAETDFTNPSFPTFESDQIKGLNSVIKIGPLTFTVPKTMTDSEVFADYSSDTSEPVLVEMKGSYSLDVKASAASNTAGESVQDVALRIKNSYLQEGYTDLDK